MSVSLWSMFSARGKHEDGGIDPTLLKVIRPELIKIALGMKLLGGVQVITESDNNAEYVTHRDQILLNPTRLKSKGHDLSEVLAHEMAHASGHELRLNRKYIIDVEKRRLYSTKDSWEEEILAETSAHLLFKKLGIPSNIISRSKYLETYGRKDGQPTKEDLSKAEVIVSYLLSLM